ncbi:MAG: hypothetical protein ACRCXZ_00650 [Patescibacteria group bacterium]
METMLSTLESLETDNNSLYTDFRRVDYVRYLSKAANRRLNSIEQYLGKVIRDQGLNKTTEDKSNTPLSKSRFLVRW